MLTRSWALRRSTISATASLSGRSYRGPSSCPSATSTRRSGQLKHIFLLHPFLHIWMISTWYWLKSSSILKFPHRSDLPVFAKPHSYAEPTIYEWRGVKEGFFDGGRAVMALRYSGGSSSNITHYVQGRQRGRYSHKYHLAVIPVIWARGTISYNSLILFPLCHPSDANFAIPSSNENETFSFYWPALLTPGFFLS